MSIDRTTLLFFDASCLIAAAGSPSGGSGFLLSVCARGWLKAAVSQPVLLEAERNIIAKLGADALGRHLRTVVITPLALVAVPPKIQKIQWRQYQGVINDKDQHVVVAVVAASAPFLITLDPGLAKEVNQADLSLRALSPGEFIKTMLPEHVDYPDLRK